MNAHGAASALSMTASSSSASASSAVSKVAASLSSSSSSSTSNWRGKYLRALNISAPEVDVSRKTPRSASGSCTNSTSSSSSAATQQQLRRARSYRVDANRNVTFSRSFHTATEREGDEFQARVNRYQVSHLARTSSRRQLQSSGHSGTNSRSAYGFAVKPDLARGRRCHTDPVVSDDKVSAPIEIPSGAVATAHSSGATLSDIVGGDNNNNSDTRYSSRSPLARHNSRSRNNNSNNASHYRLDATAGKLLSWEEPSVMLALEPQQLGGLDMAFSNLHLDRRSSSRSGATGTSGDDLFYCDEFVDTDDEDDDEDDDDDETAAAMSSDDDDPIFAMEDFDSDHSRLSSSDNNNSATGLARKSSSSRDKSRRRLRTAASASMLVAPPPSGRSAALSRFHSVRQLRCASSSSHALELPASFVPPHEMIERDCFSIGLRDEFKRRQAKI